MRVTETDCEITATAVDENINALQQLDTWRVGKQMSFEASGPRLKRRLSGNRETTYAICSGAAAAAATAAATDSHWRHLTFGEQLRRTTQNFF